MGNARTICLLWVMGLLLAVTAACGSTGSQRASEAGDAATPTPIPTPIVPEKQAYTVQVGTVIETLEFTGRASPLQQQELFFETSGDVNTVFVGRGDWVKAEDVLAQLEVSELQRQLAQEKLNLETAQLHLDQAQVQAVGAITTTQAKLDEVKRNLKEAKTTSVNDSASARAAVASAETSLANAKLNLTVVQASDGVTKNVRDRETEASWWEVFYGECLQKYAAGKITKDRLDLEYNNLLTARDRLQEARIEAELALSQARAQVAQAEESLRQAKAKITELQAQSTVADAQSAVQQAESDLAQAVADAAPESYSLRLLELAVEQARLDIQEIEGQIAGGQLIAPFDGQLLSLDIKAGDSAEAYTTVGVMADPTKLEIMAELTSDELSQMALNQQAQITLRNRPGETFAGTVRQLPYPYGGTTVDTGDDKAAHVSIEGEVGMTLGELATVSIILQEKENALWLPPAAIRTYQGRNFVVVQNVDGTQRRVDVLLGITTDTQAEIVTGLQEGQVIIGE